MILFFFSSCYCFRARGYCFCCLLYCSVKSYQAIHVRLYKSCYRTQLFCLHKGNLLHCCRCCTIPTLNRQWTTEGDTSLCKHQSRESLVWPVRRCGVKNQVRLPSIPQMSLIVGTRPSLPLNELVSTRLCRVMKRSLLCYHQVIIQIRTQQPYCCMSCYRPRRQLQVKRELLSKCDSLNHTESLLSYVIYPSKNTSKYWLYIVYTKIRARSFGINPE